MRQTPFDFDVSVTADKRRRASATGRRRGFDGGIEAAARLCDWPGCAEPARFRAPLSRESLEAHRWFCLAHVREYNARWDYYRGLAADEILARQKADSVWDRPTWRAGEAPRRYASHYGHAEGEAWRRMGFQDPLEALGPKATRNPGAQGAAAEGRRPPEPERRALDALGLPETATRAEARARYKALVKELHPDLNGGDRSEEERLKRVIQAWSRIRNSPFIPT